MLCAALLCTSAVATNAKKQAGESLDTAVQPIPAAKENRIVRFTYSPDVIFRILTTTAWHTHIALADDEGIIETPVTGDSTQWRVSGGPRNIYVKPVRDNLETSLTLVTNRRTYQFQLVSGAKGAHVYQKVSFDYPEREADIKLMQETAAKAVAAEESRLSNQVIAPNVDPTEFDFGYEIVGDAPFRPLAVYSDEKATYLRMPATQIAPAVFLLDEQNNASLVEFKPRKNYIVVERLVTGLLLKVGGDEVKILRRTEKKPWWSTAVK